ncbi:MAG: ABC transporter permease [Acidobacteriota bacterium]
MQTLIQDLRYGLRMLMKKPGFTFIAILTLALGIGATTAIFTIINSVLLRPLPYPDAERLVYVGQKFRSGLAGSGEPKFLFWREHNQSFEALAAYSNFGGAGGNLSSGNEPEFVRGLRISEDFFQVLGVYPALGRPFTQAEDTPGSAPVAILSDGLWQRRFGGDKDLLGKTVLLNDQSVTIVGILPKHFQFSESIDLYVPLKARPNANYDPNATVVGRLKSGVTLEQAASEFQSIADEYREAFPKQMQEGESAGVRPYKEIFTEDVEKLLWILFGAVGFLLLIACANVANLQLTRAAGRQKEIAVRRALGAGNGRIIRQLLTEGVLLALIGGTAGLLLAVWGTEVLIAALPQGYLPNASQIKADGWVLAFAIVAAIITGLLFGLAPAWQAGKVDVNQTLKESAGRGTATRGRLRGALVVAEVALSLVLLVGAGLLIRTFANLLNVEPGFDPRNVLTFQVALNGARYDTTSEAAAFYRDATERIKALPGVESAAVVNKLPLDWQFNMPVTFPENPDKVQSVQLRMISPEYFKVMKIALQQGREFNEADNPGAASVAIINEAFARRYFNEKNPLNQQLTVGRGLGDPMRQIVGVIADVKQMGLDSDALPMVFVPIPQMSDKLMAVVRAFTVANFTVRTRVAPLSLSKAIKNEIATLDATMPVSQILTMEEVANRSVASQRFNMLMLALFAGLGLLLAAVGIYGVVSNVVAQRTNEIGLRIALGAQSVDVVKLVVKYGLGLAISGIGLGLIASFGLTRLMKSFLFGVSATDPLTFVLISILLITIALLACYIPARRATKVDPMIALRYE